MSKGASGGHKVSSSRGPQASKRACLLIIHFDGLNSTGSEILVKSVGTSLRICNY